MNGYKDLIGFTKRGHKIGYDQHNEQSIEGSKKAKRKWGEAIRKQMQLNDKSNIEYGIEYS